MKSCNRYLRKIYHLNESFEFVLYEVFQVILLINTLKNVRLVQRYAGRLGESERNRNPLGTFFGSFFSLQKNEH